MNKMCLLDEYGGWISFSPVQQCSGTAALQTNHMFVFPPVTLGFSPCLSLFPVSLLNPSFPQCVFLSVAVSLRELTFISSSSPSLLLLLWQVVEEMQWGIRGRGGGEEVERRRETRQAGRQATQRRPHWKRLPVLPLGAPRKALRQGHFVRLTYPSSHSSSKVIVSRKLATYNSTNYRAVPPGFRPKM